MADEIHTLKGLRNVLRYVEDDAILRIDAGTLRQWSDHIREQDEAVAELYRELQRLKADAPGDLGCDRCGKSDCAHSNESEDTRRLDWMEENDCGVQFYAMDGESDSARPRRFWEADTVDASKARITLREAIDAAANVAGPVPSTQSQEDHK